MMTDLRVKLMACTRQELIDRFGGRGVSPRVLKPMRKEEMVDYLIEVFGAEFPPPPLDPAGPDFQRMAEEEDERYRKLYERMFG